MSFDPPLWMQDVEYPARVDRKFFEIMFSEGVVDVADGRLKVYQNASGVNMSVDIDDGTAVVRGDDQPDQGLYTVKMTNFENHAIAPAHATLPRIDLVALQIHDGNVIGDATNDARIVIVTGTPNVSPAVPVLPDSSIPLASVAVAANVTTIINDNIEDLRFGASLGPLIQGPPTIMFVAPDGSDSSSGRGLMLPKRSIQAALDALPGTADGGWVYVCPGSYEPFEHDLPNVKIAGLAGIGQDRLTASGGARIIVPNGEDGFKIGVGVGDTIFAGGGLQDLVFEASASGTPARGGRYGRVSNFDVTRCRFSNFGGGVGLDVEGGSAAQYGTVRDSIFSKNATGLRCQDHNGLRVRGGFIQNYDGGDVVVPGDTIGILGDSGADTMKIGGGIVIQFCETGVDLSGEGSTVGDARFEAFSIGVVLRGDKQTVGPECTFNNFIRGLGPIGCSVELASTATNPVVYPHTAQVLENPPVRDIYGAEFVRRLDAEHFSIPVHPATMSATTGAMLCIVSKNGIGGPSFLVRNLEIMVAQDLPADGVNYWTINLFRHRTGPANVGLGPSIILNGGLQDFTVLEVDVSDANDNAVSQGDGIGIYCAASGTPTPIDRLTVSFDLVPYGG